MKRWTSFRQQIDQGSRTYVDTCQTTKNSVSAPMLHQSLKRGCEGVLSQMLVGPGLSLQQSMPCIRVAVAGLPTDSLVCNFWRHSSLRSPVPNVGRQLALGCVPCIACVHHRAPPNISCSSSQTRCLRYKGNIRPTCSAKSSLFLIDMAHQASWGDTGQPLEKLGDVPLDDSWTQRKSEGSAWYCSFSR